MFFDFFKDASYETPTSETISSRARPGIPEFWDPKNSGTLEFWDPIILRSRNSGGLLRVTFSDMV